MANRLPVNLLVRKIASNASTAVIVHITVGDEYVPADSRFIYNPVVYVNNFKMRFIVARSSNNTYNNYELNVTIERSFPSNRQIIEISYESVGEDIRSFSMASATNDSCISEAYQKLKICGEHCQLTRIISKYTRTIKMTILVETSSPFQVAKRLHTDDEPAFELRAKDGSIKIYTAALAACSDVFKTMVTQEFLEKSNGFVELPYSVSTLKQFKAYLYSSKISVSELEQLAKFAHCYKLSQLEAECINQLITNLTLPKSKDLLKFAFEHQLDLLLDAVLKWHLDGAIGMEELKKQDTKSA